MELPVVVETSHGLKWDCRSVDDEVLGSDPVDDEPSASVLFLVPGPLLLLCEQRVTSPSGDACCDLSVLPLCGAGLVVPLPPVGSLGCLGSVEGLKGPEGLL